MKQTPRTRAQNLPDYTEERAARIYLALHPHLPALERFAKQESLSITKILRKAVAFYVHNREQTLDPATLHLVPKPDRSRRNDKIMELHEMGKTSAQIAGALGLSASRVRQIIGAAPKPEVLSLKVPEKIPVHFDPHEWDDLLPPEDKPKDTVEQQTPPEDFGF